MSRFVLTGTAQEDLAAITDHYETEAGERVALQMLGEFSGAFRLLAENPELGHRREDLAEDRPILFWPVRDYLILYRPGSVPLQVIMILRSSRDVPRIISERDVLPE